MKKVSKQTFEEFYNGLKKDFSKIESLPVWQEWNWRNNSYEHSVIMSEIAREMISWAKEDNYEDIGRLLNHIEQALNNAKYGVGAIIGTGFTVTIIETEDKQTREKIKALMQPRTAEAYRINLRGYKEPN
ncbi:hypothetical protein GXP67_05600 [Rhodocytophaga rosea]|uniref:DUF7674 domain-containing protein n=1 Tax=Rhodocytophaga rosea TaxID=2704465 RepID=A0A6C0GET2_9BACT|nr:hypothetical protein [Rhodocytophaga rosea]QHT66180.1 hypothetical protein GXP67_05600 [Rhodocytophaga rosea]